MARRPQDYYSTPAWCVQWLLDRVHFPPGVWLEPSIGSGAIARAVNALRSDVLWVGIEIDAERAKVARRQTSALSPGSLVFCEDFTSAPAREVCNAQEPRVAIGNPPYNQALDFITGAMSMPSIEHIAYLLRLDFLATQGRAEFMSTHTPDAFVLSERPSFGEGNDRYDYAWMVWPKSKVQDWYRTFGYVRVLTAPKSERLLL